MYPLFEFRCAIDTSKIQYADLIVGLGELGEMEAVI